MFWKSDVLVDHSFDSLVSVRWHTSYYENALSVSQGSYELAFIM